MGENRADKEKISVGAERQVCASEPIPVYPLSMKYERVGMGNIQKNCGLIVEKTVKAWHGVLCVWW